MAGESPSGADRSPFPYDPPVETDAELVARIKEGASEAFSELFGRHRGAVYRAVSDRVDNIEDRRDVVQEAFVRAYWRLGSLKEPARFRPWLLQIARHAALDHLRRSGRRQTWSIDANDEISLPAAEASPPELVELADLAARVNDGFALLSPRDATALAMTVHFGFGPRELAAALGISETNAKVVLHRARKRLRAAGGIDAGES